MRDILHRANGILKERLTNASTKHETWDLHATQLRFDWGGHVARLQKLDPKTALLSGFSAPGLRGHRSKHRTPQQGETVPQQTSSRLEMGIQHVQVHWLKVAGRRSG